MPDFPGTALVNTMLLLYEQTAAPTPPTPPTPTTTPDSGGIGTGPFDARPGQRFVPSWEDLQRRGGIRLDNLTAEEILRFMGLEPEWSDRLGLDMEERAEEEILALVAVALAE